MITLQPENPQARLIACREAVQQARTKGAIRPLCLALCDLGSALFQTRVFDQGVAAFEEAEQLAASLGDLAFQVYCLGLQVAAYRDIGRLHNAYEIAEHIVKLAETHADPGVKCDALVSQGQLLTDSGDPALAIEKFKSALDIAKQLDDKRHLMKALAGLGHLKTTVVALDEAQALFDMAARVAAELGDIQAECGYLLNRGALFVWQNLLPQAVSVFERVLTLAQQEQDRATELVARELLAENLLKLSHFEQALQHAQQGVVLAQEIGRPGNVLTCLKYLALAHYQCHQPEEAHQALWQAVAYARSIGDADQEVNMLLHLGESYMDLDQWDDALQVYRQALDKIQHLHRESDEAYLVGRIGVALAELGQLEEAVAFHRRAVELARQHAMPELEGQQLAMLALAYFDLGQAQEARACCQEAINVLTKAGLETEADKARQLLASMPL